MSVKKVFLTGATGVMGSQGLKCLLKSNTPYEITVLARDTKRNRRKLSSAISQGVKVIWGDLLDAKSVEQGVIDADIVLHVGGMVSPAADKYPEQTLNVNIGAVRNIVTAAKKREADGQEVAVVYIGSVAQYGNRAEPHHWGRTGDPMAVSTFDIYSLSKIEAERILADSGLKKWVSLRQSGILHPGLLMNGNNPITFHVPLRGVLEWATDEASGRLLEHICRLDLPERFWKGFYNIGGGEDYRLSNYDFEVALLDSLKLPRPQKVFDTNWFALRNFHGMWYEDSDKLEEYLHFRGILSAGAFFDRMAKRLPPYFLLTPLAPAFIIKKVMKKLAMTPGLGTLSWIKTNDKTHIKAFFGSLRKWENIPDWEHFDLSRPSDKGEKLDHGYDDSLPDSKIGWEQMQKAAEFRGGKLLNANVMEGDLDTLLDWECAEGHRFRATARTVLRGGHWCAECLREGAQDPEAYGRQSKRNRFLAQLYG